MTSPGNLRYPDHPDLAQVVSLATKHGKQQQFEEPFRRHLGWSLRLAAIDTDTFGTFTPETPRTLSASGTAEAKARAGMNMTGLDIGLANEGSFGPHPNAPMIAFAVELAVCVDDRHGVVIGEAHNTTDTNFAHTHVRSAEELPEWFLEGVRFPSHGLVVHSHHGATATTKGIHDLDRLIRAIHDAASASDDGYATVQTDMRAHHNPTRQRAIAIVADRLASRIATPCPSCATPGFGVCEIVLGLACERCGEPTELAASRVSGCYRCDHREREPATEFADPGRCPRCNP